MRTRLLPSFIISLRRQRPIYRGAALYAGMRNARMAVSATRSRVRCKTDSVRLQEKVDGCDGWTLCREGGSARHYKLVSEIDTPELNNQHLLKSTKHPDSRLLHQLLRTGTLQLSLSPIVFAWFPLIESQLYRVSLRGSHHKFMANT
jgi:hypothetical protein